MPGSKIADGVWLFDLPLPVKELTERGDADGLLALLEKSDGWVAYKAGECLAGVLGDPRAVEPLLRHLRAFDLSSPTEDEVEDWKTVAFALMCLEPPGSPASDELLKTLEERDFEDVEYAGKLLAAIGDQRAIEPLVKRLRSDPTGEGSYWVVSALGDLRTVEAVDALIAALPLSDNLGQENIAMALERIGDPRSIPALIVALESHHGKDWAWNPASNAILKMIEEPPSRTVFLLCAPSLHPDDVPVTIRSRCRVVGLRTPPVEAIADVLARRDGGDPALAAWSAAASA